MASTVHATTVQFRQLLRGQRAGQPRLWTHRCQPRGPGHHL